MKSLFPDHYYYSWRKTTQQVKNRSPNISSYVKENTIVHRYQFPDALLQILTPILISILSHFREIICERKNRRQKEEKRGTRCRFPWIFLNTERVISLKYTGIRETFKMFLEDVC